MRAVVIGAGERRGGLRRNALGIGCQDAGVIAQLGGRRRQHPAELPAAEDADRGTGGKGAHSGSIATAAVCAARHAFSRSASSASDPARIAAASSPAFFRPRRTDRQRPYGNAARHLHDRQQAIHAAQRLRLHRHAQHRQVGQRRDHARQVRRATGTGDDHPDAAPRRPLGIVDQPVRGAVRRDDLGLMRHAQRAQRVGGMAHRLPIGGRTHDDADEGLRHAGGVAGAGEGGKRLPVCVSG